LREKRAVEGDRPEKIGWRGRVAISVFLDGGPSVLPLKTERELRLQMF